MAFRVQCPRCQATTTLLPEGVLPGRRYSVETIGASVAAYARTDTSYRTVALDIAGVTVPQGLSRTTIWGNAELTSPYPSTVFRWVERFAAGAQAWWPAIAASTQERLSHPLGVPDRPGHLDVKARTAAKCEQLVRAWYLLTVLFLFAGLLGRPVRQWPYALLRSPRRPSSLDRTGWFALPARAPP